MSEPDAAGPRAEATPKKILVVEDSKLLHKLYDLVLRRYRRMGSAVIQAYNGAEAITLLNQHPDTDLILLDLMMPVMGGLEFLRYRREKPGLWCIYILVITSKGEEESVEAAMRAGASGLLTKPLKAKALKAEIDRLFGPIHSRPGPTG